jgi:endonuclease/exonuclease/phosphatase family metal-dependent hydrolase
VELNLITCNIRFDNPADGANAWPLRRDFLSETLLKHSPDIIATQEGRFDQLQELKSSLGNFHLLDEHRSWIKERMYPTFYLRKDKFEVINSEDLWLSETPNLAGSRSFNSAFPRLFTWVRVQPKGSAKNLLFVNTHLDHVKSETRAEQARVLAQEVKRISTDQDLLCFMGDYNEGPDLRVREILTESFSLIDSWKSFNLKEETSHHGFKGVFPEGSRIDWILVDERIEILSSEMDKTNRNGLYPTDHFPVITKIKL